MIRKSGYRLFPNRSCSFDERRLCNVHGNAVVTNLENPFGGKAQSMREITQDKNGQSLRLLLGVCQTAKRTLLSLQQSVPNSSMPRLWQAKLDAARKEYLAFAQQIGMARAEAEAALARELGEAVQDDAGKPGDVSS
jgi:hypothetical protein